MTWTKSKPDGLRVADVTRLHTTEKTDRELMHEAIGVLALPESWREYFEDQLERLRTGGKR